MSESEPRYWVFKSEPSAYSFDDLLNEENKTAEWDGVRNFQARNFMRDDMRVGDRVLFYHSSAKPTAVVGTARIVREAYPDATAWDPNDKHYDPKSTPVRPSGRWWRYRPTRGCPPGLSRRGQGQPQAEGYAADSQRTAALHPARDQRRIR